MKLLSTAFNGVSPLNPNNKGGIKLFNFIAFKMHSPIDACFNPCHTKTVINIRQKFNIRLRRINIGFALYGSYFIFNYFCGGSNNSSLYFYHYSDSMVLAISVKQTIFERSGSSNGLDVNSKHLDIFLQMNLFLHEAQLL